MPNINRIRVNNVKYNFGTQQYDDFTMRMYGKNTLYDLANGGGKSILMLLLLQNLIPNCTLDEKQPVEKLFRSGCGNTTIHSLIEWKLDESDIEEGYRYMTTGFCARKAKDAADDAQEERDTASIEYFNYCIFYRDYNANDIINLPLAKENERVTFTGLKNYLKELGRRDLSLEVQIFERKGEYQRFISQYGLYESEWEIVRGINKTEGHVRTYFETNYKTTRKVVEDLLIEEIIEKAYLVKVDKNESDDDMAKTLLDIKNKLVELSKKKREIVTFDRQTELIHVLEARVNSFLELYENKARLTADIVNVYHTGQVAVQQGEAKLEVLKEERKAKQEEKSQQMRRLASLKIKRDQYILEEQLRTLEELKGFLLSNDKNVEECTKELQLKESMNDYLDFLQDRAMKEENEAAIEAVLNQSGDQVEQLHAMAYTKRHRDDAQLADTRQAIEKEQQLVEEAGAGIRQYEELVKEVEIALAVASKDEARGKAECERLMNEIQSLRSKVQILVLGDTQELVSANQVKQDETKACMQECETYLEEHQQEYYKILQTRQGLEARVVDAEEALVTYSKNANHHREDADKLSRMLSIYGGDTVSQLIEHINQRYLAGVTDISNKKAMCEQLKHRKQELAEGRIIGQTKAAEKVKHYIESRHGMDAIFGMDFLAALPIEERKRLLSKHPLLPYGILVKNFDVLDTDQKLRELNLGDEYLPIYNRATMDRYGTTTDEKSMILLHHAQERFLDETILQKLRDENEAAVKELLSEIERLEEISKTYQEDILFATQLKDLDVLNVEETIAKQKDMLREEKELLQNIIVDEKNLAKQMQDNKEKLQEAKKQLYALIDDALVLAKIQGLAAMVAELEEETSRNNAEVLRLRAKQEEVVTQYRQWNHTFADSSGKLRALQEEEQKVLADWSRYYEQYYQEGNYELLSLSDEELTAQFKAVKAVVEKTTGVLEDKRQLIQTLSAAMSRSLRNIQKRGILLKELEQRKEEHELYRIEEAVISELSVELARLSTNGAQLKNQIENKAHAVNRLEGSIEQSIKTLTEQYGEYEEPTVLQEEAKQAIGEGDRILKGLDQEYATIENTFHSYEQNYNRMLDLFKDVRRIVETNELSLEKAQLLEITQDELRTLFEASLLAFDKSNKTLERAKGELLRYKNQTAQTLMEMQAFELAETIGQDVEVPKDLGEARELLQNLQSIISVIGLEKERVEKGIEDMEFIKSHFESQCLQRCQDVKNELEKLPKLSKIMLDGEAIQMVGLSIPYVKEEFVAQRMADYIDDVVSGADGMDDNTERIKYIRNRLVLKKLFGVIVTDMNAIKLTLYKRERIKEQSRYLRYEEAVGSTGQSQGIYIQFLVSIINYISGLYAPNAENDRLKKVIFIDNPFGAAKDVYIWEPIFALLKTNNVQLIVPARGATPAITARFDVNYILGQQLVGGKQQTVVIDYRSQVEQEELEYRSLNYEQVSFDFI